MFAYMVEPLYVKSGKEVLAADFYHPKNIEKPPVILMAPEFASLRHFKLAQFAKRFARAGYAVVLFDYRYWGGSTGRPRELVSIDAQIEDWRTMIAHLMERTSIDVNQIILWGTGLSAGYVLHLASSLKNIKAVIAQVPFVDGTEYARLYPIQHMTKALKLSSKDYMGAKIALASKKISVIDPDGLCIFPSPDYYEGYLSILNVDDFWSGEVPARVFLSLLKFRPILDVLNIQIPTLIISAKNDSLMPIEAVRESVTNLALYAEYHEWDIQHFDIYHGQYFEKAISTQLDFLSNVIGVN
jgi:uncharacterized protein